MLHIDTNNLSRHSTLTASLRRSAVTYAVGQYIKVLDIADNRILHAKVLEVKPRWLRLKIYFEV